ncbi:MAG: uracil-DNA glycosylase [Verrucomicrobiota bacterium]
MSRYLSALEATEDYVRSLQAMGVRFLNIQEKTLFALQQPVSAPPAVIVAEKEEAPQPVQAPPSVLLPDLAEAEKKSPVEAPAVALEAAKTGAVPADLGREEKAAMMAALRERALACVKCPHLVKSRRTVVFGTGDVHARLMFVGEAPGADEDARGEPFVGAAGQLLTRIIKAMGLTRETVYIANILKCRPDTPGKTSGNRKPTPEEMKTCLPWLLEQIDLVRPAVMVALGATAVEGLLGKTEGIMRLRGHFQVFHDIPVMPTLHPSYLLHNPAHAEKRKVWEDMMQVLEKLGRPITEKQRGFFLKG